MKASKIVVASTDKSELLIDVIPKSSFPNITIHPGFVGKHVGCMN